MRIIEKGDCQSPFYQEEIIMERVGFFGGCFNPPTNVHIKIANNLIKQGKLDKVVFVPVNDYYKKTDLIEAKHRLNMIKLAINGHSGLEVDGIEIMENRELHASDAFELIEDSFYAKKSSKRDRFMIMGSDNYNKMPTWKNYEKIKNKYNYSVVDRDENEISSTQIREMIKNSNEKVMEYLPKEVYNYIMENKLYKL